MFLAKDVESFCRYTLPKKIVVAPALEKNPILNRLSA